MKVVHDEPVFEELLNLSFHIALDNEEPHKNFSTPAMKHFDF